jgi:protein-tyrosine phosphatase
MHERIIDIPGAINLRDFGGYMTEDGRHVRMGRLFRSGALAHLDADGQAAFARLGITLICDLRRDEERHEEPTPMPHGTPSRLEIPIDPGSAIALRAGMVDTTLTAKQRIDFMVQINHELARDHTEDYARMFEGLLALEDGGFLVHCAAGKDRTGFACALILHTLGVPEHTVMEDYLLTNTTMDYERFLLPKLRARYGDEIALDRESIMALAGVRPEYLRAAYAAIEADFEGVEHYIEDAIGLDAGARDRLRARYLA